MNYRIDNLQYCNWSRDIFKINRDAGLNAVHATVVYHEDYDEFLIKLKEWENLFNENSDLIFLGKTFEDIIKAKSENKTAIFFGFQNCSPIEDDINLIEKVHHHGCRFMQLTYNNQSLLATGCYEKNDSGVTNFGREAIKEMNRIGIVIDMSHSGEKSTLDAIDISEKPIAITHANPSFWHKGLRNKSDTVLKELNNSNVRLGISTDVGGGTSYSMLNNLDAAYKIQQFRNFSLNPKFSFYWATLGNAKSLGLENQIGSFKIGTFADIVVLDSLSNMVSRIRMETCESLDEELFVLQTLGGVQSIKSVYIAGNSFL